VCPTKVDVKMTEPEPRLSISGIWYLAPKNALVRLVSTASRHPAIGISVVGPIAPSVPALLKLMSSPPNVDTAASTARFAVDSSFTSPTTAIARPPAPSMRATRSFNSACLRATTTTLAPSLANKRAAACPMPELAPVTIATFLAKTPISDLHRQYESGEVRPWLCGRHSDSCAPMIEACLEARRSSAPASARIQRLQRLRHALARNRFGGLEFLREDGHAPFFDQPAQGLQRFGFLARRARVQHRAPVRQHLLHARVVACGIAAKLLGAQAHGFQIARQVRESRARQFAQEARSKQDFELAAQVGIARLGLPLDRGFQPRLQLGQSGEDRFGEFQAFHRGTEQRTRHRVEQCIPCRAIAHVQI